ncbi:MAG TPA: DNA polymerase Y family protein [Ramlibacter sp.]|jgi:protein ImuB|nr:DNA polymerase Y family protein [Ramlibacter sp.]
MYWIALQPSPEADATAWGWHALQFTPRVAFQAEALLLEAGASERLFGGRKRLMRRLLDAGGDLPCQAWGAATTSITALSLLRLKKKGEPVPDLLPDDLPLWTVDAASAHLATLERIGCTTLGQLRALPRAGVSRRFGTELLQAVDAAWGQRPERYPWIALPAEFDQKLELQALATSADELLATGQHLLTRLQSWLQARNLGALAVELEWTLDLRKLDGKPLPPTESIALRTAQPTQDMKHLRRLACEQLARTSISAPANQLRLRTLQTVPWGGATTSLLPEDHRPGEKLHQLVERLSIRLGEANVTVPQAQADHRPECMQRWVPARTAGALAAMKQVASDALYPPWLLREPLRLNVKADKPWYQGPLQLLTRARRVEAAWWDAQASQPVVRDYFIARSEASGLLWVYREKLAADQERAQWFLHGLYA